MLIIISLINLCIYSIVECLFLNPNWCSGINFLISIIVFIRSYIIFQVFWKILEAVILVSLIAFGGRFFKILPLIRSIPGALLFFVLSIIEKI